MCTMKKAVLSLLLLIALSAICILPMSSCKSGSLVTNDGVYFEYIEVDGVVDEDSWIKLEGDKWSGNNGRSGSYRLAGKEITLYTDVNGEETEYAVGSLSGGTLQLEVRGETIVYVRD